MGRPALFRNDFGRYAEERPIDFAFMVRPTLRELNAFVLTLDKLLSDNIDPKFFETKY